MNKNLSTQMAELRSILAAIENKSLDENVKTEIGKDFIGILAGKSAKQMVARVSKDFGKKFEVTIVEKSAIVKPGGDAITKEIKTVYEHVDGTTTYKVLEVNGKDVSERGVTLEASKVVEQIEKSIEQGQVVKSVQKQALKPFEKSAEAEATAKAEKLSIPELEKKIASKEGSALEQKAYAKELEKKKAGAPPAETPKDKFDTAEVARERAKTMTSDQLKKSIEDIKQSPVARKEYKAELARRGETAPKPADEVPKAADDAAKAAEPKTGAEVLIKKENEKAMAEAKQALDDGTVKVDPKDLPKRDPNETPSAQVERALKEDPRYADKYDSIQNTKGVAAFWNWIKDHPKSSIGVALAVAAGVIGYGAYLGMTPDEAEEANDAAVSDKTKVGAGETEEEKKKSRDDAIAADEKAEAERAAAEAEKLAAVDAGKKDDKDNGGANDKANGGAAKVTGTETDGKATPEQDEELAKLKAQIDALIAELSKSKDPEILKRLAAVKARLGQSGQAAKTTSTEEKGEWRDVGQDYERWYGADGVDKDGQKVYNGMVRPIVYDAGQEDEISKLPRPELQRQLRLAKQAVKK